MLNRTDKVYTIQLPNRTINISIDRLKPAFILNEYDSEQTENNNHNIRDASVNIKPTTAPMIQISDKNSECKITTRSGRIVKPRVRFNL